MTTYYCVTSTFDDNGRAMASITHRKEAEAKPESTFTSTSCNDIYTDWFESVEEAMRLVEDARNA